uniref:Uncharacterized protein n=1 Tax=Kalanchoe fedtschenkoi TaxID=63787 RepID=A0A7N0T407_KALFE
MTRILMFGIGMWDIWKIRCAATYGEPTSLPPDRLYKDQGKSIIRNRMKTFKPKSDPSPAALDILGNLGMEISYPKKAINLPVCRPQSVVGASANIARVGDCSAFIVRNSRGRLIAAYSSRNNHSSPLQDLPRLLAMALDAASEESLVEICWDPDVARPHTINRAVSLLHLTSRRIPRSANGPARALAHLQTTIIPRIFGFMAPSEIPTNILLMTIAEASSLPLEDSMALAMPH